MRILLLAALLASAGVAADAPPSPSIVKTTVDEKARLAPFLARQKSFQAQIDDANKRIQALQSAYQATQAELDAAIADIQKAHNCEGCQFTADLDLQKPPVIAPPAVAATTPLTSPDPPKK